MPWTVWWNRRSARRQARRRLRALIEADRALVYADARHRDGFVPSGVLAAVMRQREAGRAEPLGGARRAG